MLRYLCACFAFCFFCLGLVFYVTHDERAANSAKAAPAAPQFAKRAPFSAVRWEQGRPEVQLDDEWFRLVSINDVPTTEILAFSQKTFAERWQKRFEEDLVELLTKMGQPPADDVKLVIQSLDGKESVRQRVPMTRENRSAIRNAAVAREMAEQERPRVARTAVSINDVQAFRDRINEFMESVQQQTGFSGVVLVGKAGLPVYEGTFGLSHLQPSTANTMDTPFRIASLSKQFTAAAILALEAEGKLSIDDHVHQHVSEFSDAPYRDITIHHLLTHTSGLPKSPQEPVRQLRWKALSKMAAPVDDYVKLAVQCPLLFDPGQDYQYSNFGYRVLSALITRVSGDSYPDFMDAHIFGPLELNHSAVARISQPEEEADIAEGLLFVGFDPNTGSPSYVTANSDRNYGAGYGSGGIYASANDLMRWDRALAADDFLSPEQKAKLFEPAIGYYACGWRVKESGLDGRVYHTHSGANEEYFSKMMRIPEDDLVIIALGNVPSTDMIDEAVEQLFRLCRSLPYQDL